MKCCEYGPWYSPLKLLTLVLTIISNKIVMSIKFKVTPGHVQPSTANRCWTKQKILTRKNDINIFSKLLYIEVWVHIQNTSSFA